MAGFMKSAMSYLGMADVADDDDFAVEEESAPPRHVRLRPFRYAYAHRRTGAAADVVTHHSFPGQDEPHHHHPSEDL